MTARVFVDTNVLVYARDRTEKDKHERALSWLAALWEGRAGSLSWQVLQEYFVTVTRKMDPPRDRDLAREDVASFATWRPVSIELRTLDVAWAIQDRYGLSWWDSLIVAAAQLDGCTHLLSEDFQQGQVLETLTVVNPFSSEPGSVLR